MIKGGEDTPESVVRGSVMKSYGRKIVLILLVSALSSTCLARTLEKMLAVPKKNELSIPDHERIAIFITGHINDPILAWLWIS